MFGGFWKKIFGRDLKSPVESFRDAYVSPLETKRKQVEMEKAGEVLLDQYRPDEHLPDSIVDVAEQEGKEIYSGAVTSETVVKKPKRARTKKGRYQADDKSTPDVNEAWSGGKSPKKTVKVTRKKAKKK